MWGWWQWVVAGIGRCGATAIKALVWLGLLAALLWSGGVDARARSASPRAAPLGATPGQFTT